MLLAFVRIVMAKNLNKKKNFAFIQNWLKFVFSFEINKETDDYHNICNMIFKFTCVTDKGMAFSYLN